MPEDIKEERWHRFMARQTEVSISRLEEKLGKRMTVLVDEIDGEGAIARSYADAPEIDGNVFIDGATELKPGQFVEVEITEFGEHDLWGRVI